MSLTSNPSHISHPIHPSTLIKDMKKKIDKTLAIIAEFGEFTVAEVEADHSPSFPSKGRLTHLVETFRTDGCEVFVYDPKSFSSDEIDQYDIAYEEIEEEQMDYILELAEKHKANQSED